MTTSQSPLRVLRAQADGMAKLLKAIDRGEPVPDPGGKIAAARLTPGTKFAVLMDDKVLTIDISWQTIRDTSEVGLAEFILKHMRGQREQA